MILNIFFRLAAVAAILTASPAAWCQTWLPDSLGAEFEKRYVEQPDDYHGPVRCTIIRRSEPDSCTLTNRGVLYIHGFNDYFFQKELADEFAAHCYRFYAVDLRKYGRSLEPGQRPFEVRNLDEYFADVDSALADMRRSGIDDITLMGHSTGGLIAAYYVLRNPDAGISEMVLNSPFLDWNLGRIEWLVPAVSALGRLFPDMKIKQGDSTVYGESLDSSFHGEWNYNRAWKMHRSPDVTAGWVRAIDQAQRALKDDKRAIRIPILLMYSSESYHGDQWTPSAQTEDAVLDVTDIKSIGCRIGSDVTPVRVVGGMHDLFLSKVKVRQALYRYMFDWLSTH